MLTQCKFQRDWIGGCPAKTREDFCEEHRELTCAGCGNQAVKSCGVTMGPMVCGAPLCGTCRHTAGTHIRRSGDFNTDRIVERALSEMQMVEHHLGQLQHSIGKDIEKIRESMKRLRESLEE